MSEEAGFKLGSQMRSEFYLEEKGIFVNHGSFGAVPKQIIQEKQRLVAQMDLNPDRWFRNDLKGLYDSNLEALAKFVGADPENIVFIPNATTGVNTVMKNIMLEREDIILLNSHTYDSCSKAIDCAVRRCGADIISLDLILPIRSEDQLIDQMVETCKRNAGIRLVIVDHISSPSAIVFPLEKLIRELHKLGVLVLVDGAHAPGQLDLNLEKLGADFYTGNLHKWCFTPRGCGFLWVNKKHRASIQPLVTSHNYQKDFKEQFFTQGTRDDTDYLCTDLALNFHRKCGGISTLKNHAESLLDWAQQMLCHALNTTVLPVPPSLQAPYMRVLQLPKLKHYDIKHEEAERLMQEVIMNHNCVTCVVCFSGHLWLRISASVYNTREDYLALKDVLLNLVE